MTSQVPARGKPASYGDAILGRRRRLTASLIPLGGKTVLDFGCGNGAQTLELAAERCRIVALDIDEADLGALSARGSAHVLPVRFDGAHIPVRDGAMDAAVSFEVLEHVADEGASLREIRRVLRPGGDFILTVPNKWWLFETHGAALPLLPWNRVPFFSWLPRPIHRRLARARNYRKGEIARLVGRCGFTVLSGHYVTAPLDALGAGALRDTLRAGAFGADTTRCPLKATAILLHCRKSDES